MNRTTDLPTESTWYPIEDAADALGISRRTVQRRINAGHLKGRKDPHGRLWVEVPLDSDRRADAVVGMETVVRNTQLADQLVESHQQAVEVYRQRVAELRSEVEARGRWLRWSGAVAAVGLIAATGMGVLSSVLASKQGATAGHLQASLSQLADARDRLQAQDAALVGLKADLAVSEREVIARTSRAEASEAMSDRLSDRVSELERERDCLAEELAAAADAADLVYLLTGATD